MDPRPLAQPNAAYLGDTGAPDPAVRTSLAATAEQPSAEAYLEAVVALGGSRLLIPIVAAGDEGTVSAPGSTERTTEFAAALIRAADGRQALLAFTGLDSLQTWEPAARPIPSTLDAAAATALEAGAQAVLVDVAGPVPFVVEGEVLDALAQHRRLARTDDGGFAWVYAAPA